MFSLISHFAPQKASTKISIFDSEPYSCQPHFDHKYRNILSERWSETIFAFNKHNYHKLRSVAANGMRNAIKWVPTTDNKLVSFAIAKITIEHWLDADLALIILFRLPLQAFYLSSVIWWHTDSTRKWCANTCVWTVN